MFFKKREDTVVKNTVSESDLKNLENILRRISDGDLSARAEFTAGHKLKPIADLVGQIAEHQQRVLIDVLMDLNDAVYQGAHNTEVLNEIATQFHYITQGVDNTLQVLDGLTVSINDLAASTNTTVTQTTIGKDAAVHAEQSVFRVAHETSNARDKLNKMNVRVKELHNSATNIDGLVAVVNGVSEQTNLLALNASIEAARASEHGRGFSVVAEEVRKLADQSKQSVGKIREQLTDIRNEVELITDAFKTMDESFHLNVNAAGMAKQNTGKLITVFNEIGGAIECLGPATEQQSAAFEEMNSTFKMSTEYIARMNESIKECNKSNYSVLQDINKTRSDMERFKLKFKAKDFIELAKTDHLIWKSRINQMLWGYLGLNAEDVRDHSACRLGKWYYGEGKEQFAGQSAFLSLEGAHRSFHQKCADAIEAYSRRDESASRQYAGELEVLSGDVFRYLDLLKTTVQG